MRCFLWVWADMGFNLLVGHLGCLHFVSPNMQISFIREKWYLSLLSDLLWGQNSHKYPDYFKAIGVNNINNKKHYRSLFLLDHQHLANLWSWRLQVSQPALSLNSGLHLQERWLTMAHPWQSGYGLRSHHSRALTVIALSLSHYLWPVFLPVSLRHCLSFGDLLHIQSKPLPSSFFIDLVTHLSLAETIFLDICQSSSNSLIAFLFWVKADSPTRLTKLLLDFSFQSRWSNLGQIYTPTWNNENIATVFSRCQKTKNSDSVLGNKVNTAMSQLTM